MPDVPGVETKLAEPLRERSDPGEVVLMPMRELSVSRERMGTVLVAVAKENALMEEVEMVVVASWR